MIVLWLSRLCLAAVMFHSMQTLLWAQTNPLSQYQWEFRPLLIFAWDANDPDAQATREALRASECELTDRDMVIGWFLKSGQSQLGSAPISMQEAREVRSRLQIPDGEFSAVLIGKDGGVKAPLHNAP